MPMGPKDFRVQNGLEENITRNMMINLEKIERKSREIRKNEEQNGRKA